MCGIFGYVGKSTSAPSIVLKSLKDIEYRGYDSWGVSFWEKDRFKTVKKVGSLPDKIDFPSSNLALGHTRWATHGSVTLANSHPHSGCDNNLVLVHNGIVENYLELKKSLKNHTFKSETDSEVIIHLIEDEYKKTQNLVKSIMTVFKKLKGLNAIVVSDGTAVVACKIGSPLVVGLGKDELVIASDPNAILPMTKKLIFLEDNQLVLLGKDFELWSLETKTRLVPEVTTVEWDHATSVLGKYKHFMMKEIHEQPATLLNITKNSTGLKNIAELINKAFGTYFIGCGTAAYSCLAGVYLFSKIAKKHVNFSVGSEFNYIEHYLTPKSLLIAVSQSGESIDVVEPVTAAKKKRTTIASLVNVLGSTLYRLSDHPVLLQAGVEKGVASTKAFIAMIAAMIELAYYTIGKPEIADIILTKSAKEIDRILSNTDTISRLASKIKNSKHIYILGRGLSYPLALEAALKIKEISYIHAEGFAGGELKHGPIALIDKGTPVIVFVPKDETREALLANAMEVKARGAYVIGVAAKNHPVFDFHFEVRDCGASSMIPNVVFAQLLGYYLAVKLGNNPDKPRNLAKSVVVR